MDHITVLVATLNESKVVIGKGNASGNSKSTESAARHREARPREA
jgi:hypothetical protein